MIVPVDAWNKMLAQLGNLHEAGQQLADARERAAKAETEAEFLRRRLAELRDRRDAAEVERTLTALTAAARNDDNLLPPMLDAVRAYATLGEIRRALEDVYGRFKEPISF